jgi:hypothetical protein
MTVHLVEKFITETRANSVILVAPGPTIEDLPDLRLYDLAFFMGDSFKRTSQRAARNVYIRANTEYPKLNEPDHVSDLLAFDGDLILASSVLESSSPVSELALTHIPKKNVYLFDQRHFSGKNCPQDKPCCDSKLTPTLQEILAKKAGVSHHYSEGATVLVHAIAIALLLDSKKIDIFGADLPLSRKNYTYGGKSSQSDPVSLMASLQKKTRIALGMTVVDLVRLAAEKVGMALLGSKAPSVFAHDFLELFCDFQYLSDCAAMFGCELRAYGEHSNLHKGPGTIQIFSG